MNKFIKIFIILFFALSVNSYAGQSGDDILEKKKIKKIIDAVQNKPEPKKIIKAVENKPETKKLVEAVENKLEPIKLVDPFKKDLSQLIAKRSIYSNGDYYPLESMLLVATLYSDKSSGDTTFKNTAILEMPDKSQIIVFEGQVIGKDKALIETIGKNDIVLKVNSKKITINIER